eukprot:gene9797-11446_t
MPLEYHKQIFEQCLDRDGLLVMSKGLGMHHVILAFLKFYSDSTHLVLYLDPNTESLQESYVYYTESLLAYGIKTAMYKKGGVFFGPSSDLSTETMLIKLFRTSSPNDGFIKAFSDEASSLTGEIGKVARVMRHLGVGRLYLWPRFHASIAGVLDSNEPDTVELTVAPTALMCAIEKSLLDTINHALRDLRTRNKLESVSMSLDDSLFSSFDAMIHEQIKPKWGDINHYSKLLIANVKLLRSLSTHLLSYDCVTFLKFLETIESNDAEVEDAWVKSEQAAQLFANARARVFTQRKIVTKSPKKKAKNDTTPSEIYERELVLEENPKWYMLYQVLQEIEEENKRLGTYEPVLYRGKGRSYPGSNNNNNNYNSNKSKFSYASRRNNQETRKHKISETASRKKQQKDGGSASLFSMGVSVVGGATSAHRLPVQPRLVEDYMTDGDFDLAMFPEYFGLLSPPYVIIHPIDGSLSILNEKRPRYIVIYDIDVAVMRMIETHKSENPNIPLRVYTMHYADSVEERKHMSLLQREKDAFESLIREKAGLVHQGDPTPGVPVVDAETLELLPSSNSGALLRSDARSGGRRALVVANTKKKVIVDSFEFRSTLPVALHAAGFEIVPMGLEIGDYVLTPLLAVERKSISDLIGSFSSGRLYAQIEAMGRVYRTPILLIEFDLSQPFALSTAEELAQNYVSQYALSSKIVMLSKAFPKMRILWSRSSHSTVAIYTRLKDRCEEPDPSTIREVPDENTLSDDTDFNYGPQDVLRKLPGINPSNIKRVMEQITNLHELSNQSLDELSILLDSPTDGKLLYDFFNQEHSVNHVPKTTNGRK